MIEPITALAFSVCENKGVFALLIGSGVSRAAQIPTGWEIILDLTRRLGTLEGAADLEDWASWYVERFGEAPSYSRLLDMLSTTADERRAILHGYLEPTSEDIAEGRKSPTLAHRAIARLVRDGFVRVLLTTNFDRLLENALREEGIEPTVIASDDALHGAVPLIHSRCYVVKLHGDYLDTRIRNTEDELAAYSSAMSSLLDRILDEHGLIVCGWSAEWDPALRAAIVRAPNRRYPMFWASRGEPSTAASDLISHRGGQIVRVDDADAFFGSLQAKVETQAALQSRNPRSLDLLVGTAKRYLARPEFRIPLHDLVDEEVRRHRELAGDPELGAAGAWSVEAFRARIARLDAISEPLVRLFAALGQWGDDSELRQCTDALQSLGKQPSRSGLVVFINLLTYPAVLIYYAYGIGLMRAGRYRTLFRWLMTEVESESRGASQAAALALFSWDWPGYDNKVWQNLDGLDRRLTALSDHLSDFLFSAVGAGSTREEFERIFERFELMASLANASVTYSTAELNEALASDSGRGYSRVPVGRSSWNSQVRRQLMAELARPETRQLIKEAGFGRGDAAYFDPFAQTIERISERSRWW